MTRVQTGTLFAFLLIETNLNNKDNEKGNIRKENFS